MRRSTLVNLIEKIETMKTLCGEVEYALDANSQELNAIRIIADELQSLSYEYMGTLRRIEEQLISQND